LGLTGINFQQGVTHYPEAINIVIERLGDQPMIEETPDETEIYAESYY
jgi:hypothetical protein